jgi:hypothetical protein
MLTSQRQGAQQATYLDRAERPDYPNIANRPNGRSRRCGTPLQKRRRTRAIPVEHADDRFVSIDVFIH